MLVVNEQANICVPKYENPPEQHYEFLEELGRYILLANNQNSPSPNPVPIFRGKFALVKKCRHLQTGEMFAAKVYGKRAGRRGERAKALNNEVSVLGIIPPHPRIVKLLEVYHGPSEVILILELYVATAENLFQGGHENDFVMRSSCYTVIFSRLAGGELYERIEQASVGMSEEHARRIVCQILEAVKHLHCNNLVHLDIKVYVFQWWFRDFLLFSCSA